MNSIAPQHSFHNQQHRLALFQHQSGHPRGTNALAVLGDGVIFNVLLTDYAMPGMNGADLVLKVRELHHELPALVITGYPGAEGLDRLPSNVAILRKPFQRNELLLQITKLVAEQSPSSGPCSLQSCS